MRALLTLEQLPEFAGPAIPALASIIESDEDYEMREWAARILAGMGPRASSEVPALIERLRSSVAAASSRTSSFRFDVTNDACVALAGIGEPAVAPLTKLLGHEEKAVVFVAVETLAEIGPEAEAAVPACAARDAQSAGIDRPGFTPCAIITRWVTQ